MADLFAAAPLKHYIIHDDIIHDDAFFDQSSGMLISGNRHDVPDESFIASCCRKSPTLKAIVGGNDRRRGRSATECSQDAAGELHALIPTGLLNQTDLLHDSTFSGTPLQAP